MFKQVFYVKQLGGKCTPLYVYSACFERVAHSTVYRLESWILCQPHLLTSRDHFALHIGGFELHVFTIELVDRPSDWVFLAD